jgi:hypothetical protein
MYTLESFGPAEAYRYLIVHLLSPLYALYSCTTIIQSGKFIPVRANDALDIPILIEAWSQRNKGHTPKGHH